MTQPTSRFLIPALLAMGGPLLAMDWPAVEVHGFVSQGYLHSTENNLVEDTTSGTFAYNEIGLNVGSQVTDRLRIGAQIFAYDLGNYGDHEILIDWAYGDYRHNDLLGLRMGRFKLPLGLYNEMLDLDLAFTSVLLPQAVYDARYREISGGMNGLQLYGLLPLDMLGSLEYQGHVGTTNLSDHGYLADLYQQGSQGFDELTRLNVGTIAGFNLNWRPPLPGLRLNTSLLYMHQLEAHGSIYATSLNPMAPAGLDLGIRSTIDELFLAGVGIEYSVNRLTVAGEFRLTHGDVDVQIDASALGAGTIEAQQWIRSEGAYLMVAYRLTEAWEVGTYYGAFWGNRNDRNGDRFADVGDDRFRAWQRDLALSLRWDVNEAWIVKVEAHAIDGTALLSDNVNPDGYERHWFLFAAKTTLSF